MVSHASAMRELASQALADGLCTHVHMFVGWLKQPSPALSLRIPEDGINLFDLASLTKPLVTVPYVLSLVRAGKLNLDDNIVQRLGLSEKFGVLSLEDVIRHRSGLPAWRNFWINRLDSHKVWIGTDGGEYLKSCLEGVLGREGPFVPGSFLYSDVGYMLLGYLIETIEQRSLMDVFVDFKRSLGDPSFDLGFKPTNSLTCVPTSFCALRDRILQGEVHDENCAALGGIAGHAGLFGSLHGVVEYLRRLVSSPVGSDLVDRNRTFIEGGEDPLFGWRLGKNQAADTFLQGMCMGHLGFTGTALWLDQDGNRVAVLLTNRVHSGRLSSLAAIKKFRRSMLGLADQFLSSLT